MRTRHAAGSWLFFVMMSACSDPDPNPEGVGGDPGVDTEDVEATGGRPSSAGGASSSAGGQRDEMGEGGTAGGEDGGGEKDPTGGRSSSGGDGGGGDQNGSGGAGSGGESTSSGGSDDGSGGGGSGSGGAGSGGQSSCCGCLCEDVMWSCSQDNCVSDQGQMLGLDPEAGFLEIPGGDYVADGFARTSPNHRLFYTFHPSLLGAEAPLALFFNGGPGSSTSTLMGGSTAPVTLDPYVTGEEESAPNPLSWDRAMHTLHLDAPGTGFSYVLPLSDGRTPRVGIDIDRDAAIVVRFLLGFLRRHPELLCNEIVLVGESYGGTRATLMLQHVLHPERLKETSSIYFDPDLAQLIAEHEQSTAVCNNAQGPLALVQQFDAQILIQPVLMGNVQWNFNSPDSSVCRAGSYDAYQCDRAPGYTDVFWNAVVARLTTMSTLDIFLGVDPRTVNWFFAEQRTQAYGRLPADALPSTDLQDTFGLLNSTDTYHIDYNPLAGQRYSASPPELFNEPARHWTDPRLGPQFLENLRTVKTLVTNAQFDMVVESMALVFGIASSTATIQQVTVVQDLTSARPGWYRVSYLDGHQVFLRMPVYQAAGHAVTLTSSGELFDDAVAFLESPEPPPPLAASQVLFPTAAARLTSSQAKASATLDAMSPTRPLAPGP